MAAKTFSNEDLYGQYCKIKNTYGIKISGIPLDDETQDIITFEMQENLQSIICLIMSLSEPVLWTELIRLSFFTEGDASDDGSSILDVGTSLSFLERQFCF